MSVSMLNFHRAVDGKLRLSVFDVFWQALAWFVVGFGLVWVLSQWANLLVDWQVRAVVGLLAACVLTPVWVVRERRRWLKESQCSIGEQERVSVGNLKFHRQVGDKIEARPWRILGFSAWWFAVWCAMSFVGPWMSTVPAVRMDWGARIVVSLWMAIMMPVFMVTVEKRQWARTLGKE